MARRRFRWTRKLYQEADSLARFLGRHMYVPEVRALEAKLQRRESRRRGPAP
jgi:hypothetical protein